MNRLLLSFKQLPKKAIVVLAILLHVLFAGAQPGKDGNITVSSLGQVVNKYSKVTANISAGATTITVNSVATDLGGLATGDLIMIYQAQGASIQTTNDINYGAILGYNSAGLYEFTYVNSVAGNVITASCALKNSYTVAGKTQVIKVPLYNNLTINTGSSIAARAWDGNTGGILAIHVRGTLTNNGVIDVAGKGFRGGKRDNSSQAAAVASASYVYTTQIDGAEKGESIAGYGPDYDLLGGRYGRGAPANGGGGGNSHNHGGGGGANGDNGRPWTGAGVMDPNPAYLAAWALDPDYIANGNALTNSSGGGRGGYSYSANDRDALVLAPDDATWGGNSRHSYCSRGGRPLQSNVESRIFFGGGGGAGDGNNDASNDGGDGGGIAYVVAKTFVGTGTVKADGATGLNTVASGNDAPGGGGGGGTIVVKAQKLNNQTLSANGGNGGNQIITGPEAEGCGGGGGGGVIATPPNGSGTCGITSNYIYVSGKSGLTTSNALTEFLPNGGTWGADGKYDIKVSPGFIPYTITCLVDLDGDGVDDRTDDLDIDNDGIPNTVEGYNGISGAADNDNDLIPNYSDPDFIPYIDSNCDGINDIFDFDLDGIPDCIDLDSDNDGITDCVEAGGLDADGDGIIDGFTDANHDGLDDSIGTGLTGTDMDGDGLMNQRDRDSDGDGITDCIEAGGTDANGDGIIDSYSDNDDDGYSDNVDPKTGRLTFSGASTGVSPLPVYDTDGDSKKDFVDIDSDNDGITDNVEAQPTIGYRVAVLQDTDHDGIFDVYDADNGGTIITPVNTDGADLPDYRDTDSDNDGVPDNIEGNDANSDGNPIPAIPVSTADSDGDGLLNAYDGVNGANVSVSGYGGTGSVSPLQDTDNDGILDWRDVDDDGDCINTSTTGAGGENVNSNSVWNDDFDQNGAPIPNYLFAKNSFSVIGASRCGNGVVSLNATSTNSGNFNWYTVSSGGSAVFTQNSVTSSVYSPSITATTNYYVDFTVGGCTSARKLVVASKIDNSFSPTVTPASTCGSGSLTLSASTGSTGTFRWYDAAVAGTLLKTETNTTTSSYTTPVISSTTTYYVEFDNGTCTGQRASVTATISAPPVFTVTDGYTCGTTSATLSAAGPGIGTFNWYNAATGGILLRSQSGVSTDSYTATSILANTDFYVEYTNGCLAPRQEVSALVNAAITAPTTTSGTSCGTGTVTLAANSSASGTFRWYDAASAGNLVQTTLGVSSDNFTTPSLSADKTYYVSYSNTQCTSSRTAATAFIVASANIVAPNVARCGTGTVFLTATSTVPGTFKWYSAVTGGTLLLTSSAGVTSSVYQTASITAGNSTTYYVEFTSASPVCTISPRKAVTASAATAPNVTPSGTLVSGVYTTVACSAGTQTLTANSNQGGTFRWYDASSGGNLVYSQTDNTSTYDCSFTTPYLSNSVDYYLEFDNGTCTSSPRQNVRINVIGASDPTVTENARCGAGTVNLRVLSQTSGSVFKWYDAASGGTLLRTSAAGYSDNYTTPSISSTTTYYVEYTVSGCTSPRVPNTATINAVPSAPTAINGSRCSNGAVLIGAYNATPTNILWYSASTGGTLYQTDNGVTVSNYTTPSISANTTYYAETNNGTCASSSRTAVSAIITTGTAVVPATVGASSCGSASLGLSASNASSGVFRWYDASSGGNLLKTEPATSSSTYATPVLSSTTNYYVAFDRGVTGACPSASRVAAAATINTMPSVPNVSNNSRCGTGTVSLTATSATSGTFYWYDAATGGTLLQTDASVTSSTYTTPSITTNTSYYVAFSNGSCTSARTKVDAIVYSVPSLPTGINNSNCGAGSVSLSATAASNGDFLWYDAPGGTLLYTDNNTTSSTYNTASISSNTNYYVYYSNGVCTSAPTTVTATINSAPAAPSVSGASRCGVGTLTLNATSATSGTFRWYTAATGGALLKTDAGVTSSSYTTPSLASTGTYYVEFDNGSCASTRASVTASINTCVTLSVDNASISEAAGTATFTATLSSVSSQDVIVYLGLTGTATGSGTDYTNGSTTITIPAGSLTGSMTVTAVNDNVYEPGVAETVIVDITSVTNGVESGTQQQTTSITDNDSQPTVDLSIDNATIAEATTGTATVTATLSNPTTQAVTVNITYGGTATSVSDYTTSSAVINIAAGATSGTAVITAVNDNVYEPGANETVTASLGSLTNCAAGTTTSVSTAIVDNDSQPAVDISINNATIAEATTGTATVTATLSNPSTQAITVNITYGGTGTSVSDYTTSSAVINIAAGATTGTAVITAVNDNVYEPGANETVTASLGSLTNCAAGTTTSVSTAIVDNDSQPTVNLSIDNATIAEATTGTATVTATLSNPSTQAVTVNITYGGTAASVSDYTTSTAVINIAAGTTTGTAVITAVNDNVYEPGANETVTATLGSLTNVTAGTTTSVSTAIVDNDAQPTVDLSINNATIAEASTGTATVTATLSYPTTQAVTVNITYGGTATSVNDYTTSAAVINIAAGANTGTAVITAVNDNVYEPGANETVTATLGSLTNCAAGTTTSVSTAIVDNDAQPTVNLSIDNATIAEATTGTATVTATLSNPTTQAVTVNITYGGTATSMSDYTTSSAVINIAAGATTGTAVITAINDNVYEPGANETVTATLGSLTNCAAGTTTSVSTSIVDNDSQPTVDLSINNATIAEATTGTATVTATLSNPSTQAVTVNITYGGTATSVSDYTTSSAVINIAAGATTGTAVITAVNDNVYEPGANETVTASLGSLTNCAAGTTTSVSTAIVDNDAQPTVDLSINNATIAEASTGTATVTATLSYPTTQAVTVNITYGGTATSVSDYTTSSALINIAAGATTGTAVITAVNDNVYEPGANETVTASLGSLTNCAAGTTTSVSTAIVDNDSQPTVNLSIDNATIAEATTGTATVTATLSNPSTQAVTVNITYGGTATSVNDYTTSSAVINIAAGATTGTAVITAVNDNVYEQGANETVTATLGTLTNCAAGTTTSVSTAIVDNDSQPTVDLSINNATIAEATTGTATVTATLSNPTTQAVTVNITYGGTATSVSDYTTSAAVLNIAAGATTGTAVITAVNDNVYEPGANETVTATLGSLTNCTAGTTTSVSTAIVDNDSQPTVDLSINNATIAEATTGTATVTATLSNPTTQAVTVNITYGGTATSVSDYTTSSAVINIAAGATTGTAVITAVNDNVYEPGANETVTATLGSLTNCTAGTTTSVSTAIVDNDSQPTVTLSLDKASITEAGAEVATITATLSNPTTQSVTVDLGFTGTTVVADYTLSDNTITIAAGSTSGSITLTAIDDLLSEGDESVIVDITAVTNGSELGIQQVSTTIIDNDVTGISVSAISGNTSENGTTATYTIVLNTQPTANVTIPLSSNDLSEGTLTVSDVVFTSANWNVAQTVTVTGADDPNIDGDISYKIITGAAVSTDGNYNGLDASDVNVVNVDNDVAPSITDAVINLNENAPNSTSVYNVNDTNTGNDNDGNGDAIQYSITAGNSDNAFAINTATGEISVADATKLDYESVTNFILTILASDGTNTDNATITINLNNLNDNAPMAATDSYSVNEGGTLTIPAPGVLANDNDADGNSLTAVKVTNPAHGTLTFNADGSFTYTHDGSETTSDAFTYKVNDGTFDGNTVTISITINPVNDPPVVSSFAKSVNEDNTLSFALADFTGAYSDPENDPLTKIQITSLPANGVLKLSGVNVNLLDEILATDLANLTFVPDANWNGSTSFTWNGSDGTDYAVSDATVNITVNAVNDPPVLSDITTSVNEDNTLTFSALDFTGAFSDVEGNSLTRIKITSLPANGTLKLGGVDVNLNDEILVADLGTLTFVPDANWNGSTFFGWNGFDGTDYATTAAKVNITVNAVNDAPSVADIYKGALMDATVTFAAADFTGAYSDVESDPLAKIMVVNLPANGTLYLSGVPINAGDEITAANLGNITFVPTSSWNGSTSFAWNASDGSLYASSGANVNITISATLNNPPMVSNISKSVDQNNTLTFTTADFTGAYSDADSNPLVKIKITSLPANATLKLSGIDVALNDEIPVADLGNLTLGPDVNWSGNTSFGWNGFDGTVYANAAALVNATVVANNAPVVSTVAKTVNEDNTLTFTTSDFTGAYSDAESDPLVKIKITSLPPNGSLKLSGNPVAVNDEIAVANIGNLTFTPSPDWNGGTSFGWNGFDGIAYAIDDDNVNITVNPVNDLPTLNDVTKTASEDNTVTFSMADFTGSFTDLDGDALVKIKITSLPANGTLMLSGVPVNVNDEIPVANLGNLTFVPTANWNGSTSFAWNGYDGTSYAATDAHVNITINAVNDPPSLTNTALPQSIPKNNGATTIDILGNTVNTDGDVLITSIVTNPKHGTATVDSNGKLVYTPDANYVGNDTITYQVCDNGTPSLCATGKVIITVTLVNTAPVINTSPINQNMNEDGGSTTIDVPGNTTNNDGDVLTISVVKNPAHGSVMVDGTGKLVYTPNANFNGKDTITYQVCDNGSPSLCATGTAIITVTPVNDPPALANPILTWTLPENNGATTIDIPGNTVNTDGDVLTTSIVNNPKHGTVTIDSNGRLVYTPSANYVGNDTITYQVCDNGTPSLCATGKVVVTITSTNHAPALTDVSDTTVQDKDLSFTRTMFTSKFTDADNDTLVKIRFTSLPSHGTLMLNGILVAANQEIPLADINKVTFVPEPGYIGQTTFAWQASDGKDYSATSANITITMTKAEIFVPEGFSPNGDGVNDYFVVTGADKYIVTLRIYNRWGNLVYESKHYKNDWDGIANTGLLLSSKLPDGTYFYSINFNNGEKEKVGFITINR